MSYIDWLRLIRAYPGTWQGPIPSKPQEPRQEKEWVPKGNSDAQASMTGSYG